jgi:hypothetical protein
MRRPSLSKAFWPVAALVVSASLAAGSVSSPSVADAATSAVVTAPGTVTRQYAGTTDPIANPDRGMYHYTETHYRSDGSGYTPLDVNQLTRWRTDEGITLVYRVFYLEAFAGRDRLSSAYLNAVRADLATARAAGVRLVVRFAYSDSTSVDASPSRVQTHIQQLAPVLNASADVISVLQAGFIGRWGEWYYSDSFTSDPDRPWQLTDADWASRGLVLQTLLATTNAGIKVQVRYPAIAQRLLAGSAAAVRDRVGIHDDCFLASDDDYGTFSSAADRDWLAQQTRTAPMGGETCAVNAPRSLWASASTDLSTYHWSFLNADYHPDVLDSWGAQGRAEMARRLGYRLRLETLTVPRTTAPGASATVTLGLVNDGYAAPLRTRPVRLLLASPAGTRTVTLPLDLRTLAPGQHTDVTVQVGAPSLPGTYALFLVMPDASSRLAVDPAYAIRLANADTWDAATGWNDLHQTLVVTARNP